MQIAFTGWAGSGKTQAAKYLKGKYGGTILSFANPIKHIDNYVFNSDTKVRDRLQKIGDFFRNFDEDVWVNHMKDNIEIFQLQWINNTFIDDLRRMNEYEMLSKQDFTIVRIVANEELRIQRLIERDGSCDTTLLYNESERGCEDLDLFEIDNNGTLEELYKQLDDLV